MSLASILSGLHSRRRETSTHIACRLLRKCAAPAVSSSITPATSSCASLISLWDARAIWGAPSSQPCRARQAGIYKNVAANLSPCWDSSASSHGPHALALRAPQNDPRHLRLDHSASLAYRSRARSQDDASKRHPCGQLASDGSHRLAPRLHSISVGQRSCPYRSVPRPMGMGMTQRPMHEVARQTLGLPRLEAKVSAGSLVLALRYDGRAAMPPRARAPRAREARVHVSTWERRRRSRARAAGPRRARGVRR